MAVQRKYLEALLDELMRKEGKSPSKKEFQAVSEKVGLSTDYLYKNFREVQNAATAETMISARQPLLETIVRYLGYTDFRQFKELIDNPLPSQLTACVGSYYSYVRRNIAGPAATVFRSPVRIFSDGAKIVMELRGKRLAYRGVVHLKKGCLFVVLESEQDKRFHHVYRIGEMVSPKVLQGMFSGVSNDFDPIAGRAVLVRMEEGFENLDNQEIEVPRLRESRYSHEQRLASYFEKYSDNNLSLSRVYSFDEHDLV